MAINPPKDITAAPATFQTANALLFEEHINRNPATTASEANLRVIAQWANNVDGMCISFQALLFNFSGGAGVVYADGSVPFTATVGGVDPIAPSDLTTKLYVDAADTEKGQLNIGVDSAPDVSGLRLIRSGSAVVLTNMTGGRDQQVITFLCEFAATVTHNANIKLRDEESLLMRVDDTLTLINRSDVWQEIGRGTRENRQQQIGVDSTPTVDGLALIRSGSFVTLTDFVGGRDQQRITFLCEFSATVQHSTGFRLRDAATIVMSANDTISFIKRSAVWYETGRSISGHEVLADGTVDFTAAQVGVTPTLDAHLATKGYADANITTHEAAVTNPHDAAQLTKSTNATNVVDRMLIWDNPGSSRNVASAPFSHEDVVRRLDAGPSTPGALAIITDGVNRVLDSTDILPAELVQRDGSVDFTAVQVGVDPTDASHLATRSYVDTQAGGPFANTGTDATPSVAVSSNLQTGDINIITDFDDPSEGQSITFLCRFLTTITHTAAQLELRDAVSVAMGAGDTISFKHRSGIWYETARNIAGVDVLANGSIDFTAVQVGVTPTGSTHLATKGYVDAPGISSFSGDVSTFNASGVQVATLSGSTTNLQDLTSSSAGQTIILIAGGARTVDHATNIQLDGDTDFDMTQGETLTLVYDGSNWLEVARRERP